MMDTVEFEIIGCTTIRLITVQQLSKVLLFSLANISSTFHPKQNLTGINV